MMQESIAACSLTASTSNHPHTCRWVLECPLPTRQRKLHPTPAHLIKAWLDAAMLLLQALPGTGKGSCEHPNRHPPPLHRVHMHPRDALPTAHHLQQQVTQDALQLVGIKHDLILPAAAGLLACCWGVCVVHEDRHFHSCRNISLSAFCSAPGITATSRGKLSSVISKLFCQLLVVTMLPLYMIHV